MHSKGKNFINTEKRRSKRIVNSLNAEFTSRGKKYVGAIENFSKSGLLVIAASIKSVTTFIPETTLKLKFQYSKGGINLHCEIRWVHINRVPLHGFRYRMGVEIKDPPSEFRAFLKTLK